MKSAVRVCLYCMYSPVSTQAELLTGFSVSNVEEAHRAAQELLKRGCQSVIITLGSQGCVVLKAQESTSKHVPTTAVTAVDTTVSMTCFICASNLPYIILLFILAFWSRRSQKIEKKNSKAFP